MKTIISFLFVSLSILSYQSSPLYAQTWATHSIDSLALIDFYNKMGGPNWTYPNLGDSNPWLQGRVATWYGVSVKRPSSPSEPYRVWFIDLMNNNLKGNLPRSIGRLIYLEKLLLSQNQIEGAIPDSIKELSYLTDLALVDNQITNIPESIGSLTNLKYLWLSRNQINDTIPRSIGGLINLETFDISENQVYGTIPSEIGNMSKLKILNFYLNKISGELPGSVVSLRKLEHLRVPYNDLSGIPDLSTLSPSSGGALQILWINNNRLAFKDIVPNMNIAINYVYAPQDSLGEREVIIAGIGDTKTLERDYTTDGNEYQWIKDEVEITGEVSNMITINITSVSDYGEYVLKITNPAVPDLVLHTRPIILKEGEVITVNSIGDDSDNDLNDPVCWTGKYIDRNGVEEPERTLRAAIETINQRNDEIRVTVLFDIPSSNYGPVEVYSQLPEIRHPLIIDGTSQPTMKLIEIDGTSAGQGDDEVRGLIINSENVEIKGLSIHSFDNSGIEIIGGSNINIIKNKIGYLPDGTTLHLNLSGIRVLNNVHNVTIGGEEDDEMNNIAGGIVISGNDTYGIKALKNKFEIALIDLSESTKQGDGPSVFSWKNISPDGPNKRLPTPQILSLSENKITGYSRPNCRIFLYEVEKINDSKLRYFPEKVKPIDDGVSDNDGYFEFDISVDLGTILSFYSIDSEGNTSEFTQLKRPIIFIPDIGGSILTNSAGDNLWPPKRSLFDTDADWDNRIEQLAMSESGENLYGEVLVKGLTESISGFEPNYKEILDYLEANGYKGNYQNQNTSELDLWRFSYDWRQSPYKLADELKKFIDNNVLKNLNVTTREVDIIAHGMGGMIASIYLKKYGEQTRNSVNRLITIGTAYLGAPEYAQMHTKGYVLDLEKFSKSYDPNWGKLIKTFRNFPSAYSLLPSKNYFKMEQSYFYIENISGEGLDSWAYNESFMSRAKITGGGNYDGLGRNKNLIFREEGNVHSFIDSWNEYQRPPQIYRIFGGVNKSTPHYWTNLNWAGSSIQLTGGATTIKQWVQNSKRREDQLDTDWHVLYREGLSPIMGNGDGIVTVQSARLKNTINDYSGSMVTNWINDDESFPCMSKKLLKTDCAFRIFALSLFDRILNIISSHHKITKPSYNKYLLKNAEVENSNEIFYVLSNLPISVRIENQAGNYTGPVSIDSLGKIKYELNDIGYWASSINATISVPTDSSYTILIEAIYNNTSIQPIRLMSAEDVQTNILFNNQVLSKGGGMIFQLTGGGTTATTPFEVDSTGDGVFEKELPAVTNFHSDSPAPAIPMPSPPIINKSIFKDAGTTTSVILNLPDVQGPSWNWALSNFSNWIAPLSLNGTTPAEIILNVNTQNFEEGTYSDTLIVTLSIDQYEKEYPVVVNLSVFDQTPALSSIIIDPEYVNLSPGESQQFTALGFDQVGNEYQFSPTWNSSGGTIDENGLFIAGESSGIFYVTASNGDISHDAIVEISSLTGVTKKYSGIPTEYFLSQNFPNPFNPVSKIIYGLPQNSFVKIDLYSSIGERVTTLINENISAGYHVLSIDGTRLSSGIYFVRISTKDFIETKKIILMK